MKFLRVLLFPFSLVYGIIVIVRNFLYDKGIFVSHAFDIPVISVGNLAVGGAGKSPIAEYIIRLCQDDFKVATLSRGYGRKTKGFKLVDLYSKAYEVGDEPLQFKNKFPEITVAVCEDRVEGIAKLEKDHNLIVMDDAYQHRSVKPGLSILLFDYSQLFKWQWLLPSGNLREPLSGKKRADIIIVSKSPAKITETEKENILLILNPSLHQKVFFSYLDYGDLVSSSGLDKRKLSTLSAKSAMILITGIANANPLINKLKSFSNQLIHHSYPDHHLFSKKNIAKLVQTFNEVKASDKIIITTEKDRQRLKCADGYELLKSYPVYYLPIKAQIHNSSGGFNSLILNYVTEHTNNNRIYKEKNRGF